MNTQRAVWRILLLSTAMSGVAGSALAAAPADVTGGASGSNQLEELVVTAQKRSERLVDVPASVGAIGGDKLQELNVRSSVDFASYIPGFNVLGTGSPGRTGVTLRGIASIGPGAVVGTTIDETPMGSSGGKAQQFNTILDLMPYDLDRLEVLRGPQGTLYGASAMGGIVKYVLVAPRLNAFSAKIGADVSTIDGAGKLGWGVRAAANFPVVTDKLALRISAYDEETPGYIDNLGYVDAQGRAVNPRTEDTNDVSQKGARAALLWQVTDNLSVNLGGMWERTHADDLGNVALRNVVSTTEPSGAKFYTGRPTLGERVRATGAPEPFTKNIDLYTATVKGDLGFANLVSATGYSRVKTISSFDNTYIYGPRYPVLSGGLAPVGVGLLTNNFDLKKFTQELRLSSPEGHRVEWLAGAFYTYEDSGSFQIAPATTFAGAPITFFGRGVVVINTPTTYEEVSVFGDLTVHVTDRLRVIGGARFAKSLQNYNVTNAGAIIGNSSASNKYKEDAVTWMINPSFHVTPDSMIYARVATGYRPGGANIIIAGVPTSASYGRDKLINYEVGFKTEFMDHRASLDVAAFHIDWTDIQVFVTVLDANGINRSFLNNAGKAISKGVEFQGALIPINGLRLGLNGAYTEAYIDSVPASARTNNFVIGAQLPNVPKFSGAFTADYRFPVMNDWQGKVGVGARYVGKKNAGTITTTGFNMALDGYTVVDLNAGLSNPLWTVRMFARNVTNKRAFTAGNVIGSSIQIQASLLQPRTVGLAIDRSF